MKNGRLQIPEQVKDSTEYKVKLQRFLDSYVIFTKLYNNPETNNYVVKSREMVEGNNTWYLIMDYDEAKSLESYIEKEPPLYRFMCTLKKIAEAIMHVHQQGYLHMDITPGNILRFSGGGVRLMDVDSFINKEDILQGEPRKVILSYSRGYTDPEVVAYFENNLFSKNTFWKMGEKVDIFSIGAILYRYLFGKQLDFETECLLGGSLLDMDKVTGHLKQFEYERNFRGAVCSRYKDCPEKGISLLRAFMRKLLARDWKDRADSMEEVIRYIDQILPWVNGREVHILDNFHPNTCKIYGRKEKLEELENAFAVQSKSRGNRIVAVTGIAGIGKSTLAREYASANADKYDVIVEINTDNAKDAVAKLEFSDEREQKDFEKMHEMRTFYQHLSKARKLIHKDKVLLIIHDYDVEEDKDFDIWEELECDILLTSRNDWTMSGIKCVTLRTEDLSAKKNPGAAIDIFRQFYLWNAEHFGQEHWIMRLEEILRDEADQVIQLVDKLNWHPLSLKLLAMQMSCFEGAEVRPKEMLDELEEYGIQSHAALRFQNEKDSLGIRMRDAKHHLEDVFCAAIKKGRLSADELEVLRFMTLVPAKTGISVQRFEEWTGLSKEKVQCLQLLRRKGWLEYDGEKEDVLWWEKPFRRNMHTSKATPGGWIELKQYGLRPVKGVYFMLMSLGDVLSVREETMPDEKRCYRYIGKCFDKDSKKTSFWGRTVFNTQVELLVRRFKETSNVFTIINLCWELYSGKEITNKLSLNEKEKLIGYFIESLGKKHYFNTFWYISLAQSYLKEKDELKAIMNIEKDFKCCKMDDCQLLSIKVYDIVWRVCLECEHIELASKYFEQVLELRNKYLHPEIEEMIQYHVEYAMKCMTESLKYGLAEKDRQNHYKEAVRCLEKEIEYCIKECGEDDHNIIPLYIALGYVHLSMEKKESVFYFEKVVKSSAIRNENAKESVCSLYQALSRAYYLRELPEDWERGLFYHQESQSMRIQIAKMLKNANELTKHGKKCAERMEYESAITFYKNALETYKQIYEGQYLYNNYATIKLCNLVGEMNYKIEAFEESLKYFHEALSYCRRTEGDECPFLMVIYYNIALAEARLGNKENAMEYYIREIGVQMGPDSVGIYIDYLIQFYKENFSIEDLYHMCEQQICYKNEGEHYLL